MPPKKPKKAHKGSARVRMYRSGLGDCFLLTFPRKQGAPFHMLVDCGVFYKFPDEKQRMRDIAAHIRDETNKTIDLVVGTHEHYDHLIGFKHAKDVFEGMTINEVWLPWVDRPGDPRAAWLRAIENKLKLGLRLALEQAFADPALAGEAGRLQQVLEFGGNPLAADYSEQLGVVKRWLRDDVTQNVRFPEPHGDAIELLPGVRVYPLGPPLKEAFFRQMNDTKQDPETYHAGLSLAGVPAFMTLGIEGADRGADADDATTMALPFETRWRIPSAAARTWRPPGRPDDASRGRVAMAEGGPFFAERYGFGKKDADAWRRIDNNWLTEAETLALQLDSLTNNSSLALAIEVGSARRVILMAADAQVGNWLSWHSRSWKAKSDSGANVNVTAEDLLGRTVLYKVGHHGSHNATLKQRGLALMKSEELVAMIPVNQKFANDVKGWEMPFPGLLSELTQRTKGRVIRADTGLPAAGEVQAGVRQKFAAATAEGPLYCDYFVPM